MLIKYGLQVGCVSVKITITLFRCYYAFLFNRVKDFQHHPIMNPIIRFILELDFYFFLSLLSVQIINHPLYIEYYITIFFCPCCFRVFQHKIALKFKCIKRGNRYFSSAFSLFFCRLLMTSCLVFFLLQHPILVFFNLFF